MFSIKYNASTNHIAGVAERTQASGDSLNYSLSACSALSRNGHKMATGKRSDNLADLVAFLKVSQRRACINCLAAAEAELAR